jgi:photosystem II stability/assembly factor-like uncharacterized protein
MKKLLLAAFLLSGISLSAQWNNLSIANGNPMTNCSFPSNDTGYITSAKIYRTFNGGTSFDSVAVPTMTQYNFIDFRTTTDGVVSGLVSPSGYGIFRTLNAGTTWQNITPSNVIGSPMQVKFADALHGTMTTSSFVFYNTANGGLTWDTLTFGYDYFNAIDFPTTTTGYIGGFDGTFNYRGVIAKTTDAGVTWSIATNFTQNYSTIQQIQFVNADSGFASYSPYMLPGHLIRTRDGAATWDTVLFNNGAIVKFAFLNYMNGFIVNDSGSIYKTTDAGVTWTLDRAQTTTIYDINVTPLYAYAVGDSNLAIKRTLASGIPIQQYYTELKVYPNPGADRTTVLLPHGTNVTSVSAMDITGRNCGNISFTNGNTDEIILDTHALAKGCYVLEIVAKDQTLKVKFEKAR